MFERSFVGGYNAQKVGTKKKKRETSMFDIGSTHASLVGGRENRVLYPLSPVFPLREQSKHINKFEQTSCFHFNLIEKDRCDYVWTIIFIFIDFGLICDWFVRATVCVRAAVGRRGHFASGLQIGRRTVARIAHVECAALIIAIRGPLECRNRRMKNNY